MVSLLLQPRDYYLYHLPITLWYVSWVLCLTHETAKGKQNGSKTFITIKLCKKMTCNSYEVKRKKLVYMEKLPTESNSHGNPTLSTPSTTCNAPTTSKSNKKRTQSAIEKDSTTQPSSCITEQPVFLKVKASHGNSNSITIIVQRVHTYSHMCL